MTNFFAALAISLASLAGLSCQAQPAALAPAPTSTAAAPQTAIILSALVPIQKILATSTASSTSSPTSSISAIVSTSTLVIATNTPAGTANVVPNLLPLVVLPPFLTSTTTIVQFSTTTATTTPLKKTANVKVITKIQKPISPMPSTSITAQSILNGTTVSINQGLNGLDRLTFTTNLGSAGSFSWGMLDTTIGGTGVIPKFDVSPSCTPPAGQADPNDPNQNPLFRVRTAYDCTVSVTPLSGNDMRTMSKDFTFTTPPGQLSVSVAPDSDTLLQNDTNNGGFTFNNEDNQPITITGLTVDVSFSGVKVSNLFVLRFADPTTGSSLFDYSLQNSPATGVSVPITLTIPANAQKVLPVQAIGVYILEVDGTSPAITVTLRGVTTNDSIVKTQIVSPTLSWNCVVPTVAYDPYATSSPFLSGDVCGN